MPVEAQLTKLTDILLVNRFCTCIDYKLNKLEINKFIPQNLSNIYGSSGCEGNKNNGIKSETIVLPFMSKIFTMRT